MNRTLALATLALGLLACGDDAPERKAHPKRLVVFGVDGMDPRLLRQYIAEGRMPNLARMATEGSFIELGTSFPPQSPVAWSDFITGARSQVHGIYDFVHRDPKTLSPYLSTSRTFGPYRVLSLGDLVIPLSGGGVELLREGVAFWEYLSDGGVPSTIVKVPANFPPDQSEDCACESLSGMGTPDLMGTYGTFQLLTNDPELLDDRPSGGMIHALTLDGQRARGSIEGPPDPMSAKAAPMKVSVEVVVDKRQPVALVRLGDTELVLKQGEWSPWQVIGFDPGLLAGAVPGMVRVYVKTLQPYVTIYISPVNLDPMAPAMPISSPESYAEGLAREAGRFYTQGMPQDTKALAGRYFSDQEFMAQEEIIFHEELAMLDREVARYQGGFLFYYFGSIDQVCHAMFRTLDPKSPPEVLAQANVIPELYTRVDRAIGEAREKLGPDTTIIVMSDHGFSHYEFKVNLNTWLLDRGYLALADTPGPGALGHVDWNNTQAYAIGLNQLFLNVKGREPNGVVDPGEREVLIGRLTRELESFRDPTTGAQVITKVIPGDVGPFTDRAPDLLVGFARGYRSSDESAIGQVQEQIIVANEDKWSGDHCMDPAHVPGVFLSTAKITRQQAHLVDLAPTILSFFGVPVPRTMEGTSLFGAAP